MPTFDYIPGAQDQYRGVLSALGVPEADNGIRNAACGREWDSLTEKEQRQTLASMAIQSKKEGRYSQEADNHYQAIMRATGGRTFDEFAALFRRPRQAA